MSAFPHPNNPNPEPLTGVPDQLELPTWLNLAALPHPEALNGILDEARDIEAGLVAVAEEVTDLLLRARVVRDAVYVATEYSSSKADADDLPGDAHRAVVRATGIEHITELVLWLTGTDADFVVTPEERDRLNERWGYLDGWDDRCHADANRLGGLIEAKQ